MLNQIKSKLDKYAHKVPINKPTYSQTLTQDNDQLSKNILTLSKIKPAIGQETFYLFPTEA